MQNAPNPYEPPLLLKAQSSALTIDESVPELTAVQRIKFRELLHLRAHPTKIERFLNECGIDETKQTAYYNYHNIRPKHLLDLYQMKRNVKIIGVLLVLLSICIPVVSRDATTIIVDLGLLAYGICLIITGSFSLGAQETGRNAKRLR